MKSLEDMIEDILLDTTGRKITEITFEIAKQFRESNIDQPHDLIDQIYTLIEANYPCIEYTVPNDSHIKIFVLPKNSSLRMIRNDS